MKVLLISHMYPYAANMAKGIFVHQQALELRRQGCQVTVIAPRPWTPGPLKYLNPRWHKYAGMAETSALDGIAISRPAYLVLPRGIGMASAGHRLYRAIKNTVAALHGQEPFDLIHAHTALPDGQAGLLLKRQLGIPLAITIHGKDVQQTAERNSRCRQAIIEVVGGADRVIAVSAKIKGLVDQLSQLPERTVVIHNGFAADGYKNLKPSGKSASIISVSNLVSTKGLALNIQAVARLRHKYPDIRYIVVGGGPEEANLRALTKSLQVEDKVEFTGPVPNHQVPGLLGKAKVFSLPSTMEGFGIAYLEAMAAGLPVIACQGQGIADILVPGDTGLLVEPHNLEDLVRALDELLAEPERAGQMGARARKMALSQFSWQAKPEQC